MDRRERLDDPEEAQRLAMEGWQAQMWTALPGIVSGVNLEAMTLTVQPTIQGVVTNAAGDNEFVNLPLLLDVPIVFPSAGGFIMTFPIKSGDEVLVVFSSRAMDAWWQSGGVGRPVEARMHDLSDGFAIPGPRSQAKKVANISTENVQLRADDGETYIEITPDQEIKLVSPIKITIDAPLTEFTGAITTGTNPAYDDYAEFAGNVISEQDVVAQGRGGNISLNNHVHDGVQSGGGNTGDPVV